jgi:predicted ABC-type ATPase
MKRAQARGYKLNLIYVGVRDSEQSRSRVAERTRSGGHPVPIADIVRRFDRSMQNLPPAMRLSHRVLVLDNSGERARLLLRIENGRTRHVTRRLSAWAKKAIPASLRREPGAGQGC